MRYLALLPMMAAAALGTTLTQYGSVHFSADSMAGAPARTEVTWTAILDAGSMGLQLEDRFLLADSGGTVPRWNREGNDLLLSARASFDRFLLKPDIRWQTATSGDSILLGVPNATRLSQGDMLRPGATIEAYLGPVSLHGFGRYWQRDLYASTDEESGWQSTGYGGGASWVTPLGARVGVSGTYRGHTADVPELDRDWSRTDIMISTRPMQLPARTQVLADLEYSLYAGEDYTGGEIADRLSGRVRAVQSISQTVSYNMTMAAAMDYCEDGWSVASGMAAARLRFLLDRGGEIPSVLSLGSSFSTSVFSTAHFDLFSRFNIYRGLSLLGNIDARRTPTDVSGAPESRRSLVLGGGAEYQLRDNVRCWMMLEQERTEYQETENWGRMRAGLDLYSGVVSL